MAGRFITFEGGEGAGKSTQIARLAARVAGLGIPVVTTREPGGTPIADRLRSLLLSGAARGLGPEGEAVLFAAARADHVQRVIRPALAAGRWVLSDRFMDSTKAYQGTMGVSLQLLDVLEAEAVGETRPDLTVVLDIDPEIGLLRAARRAAADGPDRFEADTLALHRRRRQMFLAIAASEPSRVAVVDAGEPADAVEAAVWQAVETRLMGSR